MILAVFKDRGSVQSRMDSIGVRIEIKERNFGQDRMIDKGSSKKKKMKLHEERVMKKKEWKKPELVILARGNPEENILKSDCKYNSASTGIGDIQSLDGQGCKAASVDTCAACQGLGGSGS